jgi:hypothetical protein
MATHEKIENILLKLELQAEEHIIQDVKFIIAFIDVLLLALSL